jgi:hypothetical protein
MASPINLTWIHTSSHKTEQVSTAERSRAIPPNLRVFAYPLPRAGFDRIRVPNLYQGVHRGGGMHHPLDAWPSDEPATLDPRALVVSTC